MENLGLFIYLAGIADAVILIAWIAAVVCMGVSLVYLCSSIEEHNDDDKKESFRAAKRWALYLCLCLVVAVFVPSKKTCYQIFGVTKAVELYRSSESLQQLPEKSIEALNRLLDSIAPEEGKAE